MSNELLVARNDFISFAYYMLSKVLVVEPGCFTVELTVVLVGNQQCVQQQSSDTRDAMSIDTNAY